MKHKMSETSTEKLMQPEELKALTKESYEEGYKELVRLLNLEFKKAATSGKFMITITIPPLFKKDIIPQLEDGIQVTDVAAGEKKTILPTKSMFGFDFVTKVVSMIDFTGNTASENNPFGNLMPLMLMCGDGGLKENLIPMMFLMNQTNGEDKGTPAFDMSNPLLLMALMQDKGGSESNDFFTMMILGQMMKSK